MANPGPASVATLNTQLPFGNIASLEIISVALTPTTATINTCVEQTFSGLSTGIVAGDVIVGINKPTLTTGCGIAGWRVDSSVNDKFYVTFVNATGTTQTPAAETYQIVVAHRPQPVQTISAVV